MARRKRRQFTPEFKAEAAAIVAGLALLLTGDDPHRYDRPPSLEVDRISFALPALGGGSIVIGGHF